MHEAGDRFGLRLMGMVLLLTAVIEGAVWSADLSLLATEPTDAAPAAAYPPAIVGKYQDSAGSRHVYLVQEPARVAGQTNLLIYLHGAAGKEEQGMDPVWTNKTFHRLRLLMVRWGWIYVCPRDYEFEGLLRHLHGRYRPGAVYLAGASAGGREAFREARQNPRAYAGLILLCPAEPFPESAVRDIGTLTMPIWLETGARDGFITEFSRSLARNLARDGRRHRYVEIPDGDHGAPLAKIAWDQALGFVQPPSP